MIRGHTFVGAAMALFLSASIAHAAVISTEASDNATVQPGGPRSGTSGKAFFNVEGSANGSFASYGVAEFNFGVLPMAVISVTAATLSLTQSNAAFSTTGDIVFSLDRRSPYVDMQPVTSPLAFDGVDPGTGNDVGQGDLILSAFLGGPFSYVVGTSGDVNNYALGLDGVTAPDIVSRLNGVQPIRVVIGSGQANVAATWAGSTNSTYVGPTLQLEVVYDTGTPTNSPSWGRIKSLYR
jgi:hypothetical protein